MEASKKAHLKRHLGYGAGYLPDSCFYQFISSYQLLFLTSVVGMSAKNAGTVASVTILADAIFSVFVGRFSDNLRSRFGRRRPLLAFTMVALPLAFFMMFRNFQAAPGSQLAYYLAMGFLFWILYATYFVAYVSLGAEVATDYEDRIVLNSVSRVFSITGGFVSAAAPLTVIAALTARGIVTANAWLIFAGALAAVVSLSLFLCWNSTRGCERVITEPVDVQGIAAMVKDFKELLRIKPYRRLIYSKICANFTYSMYAGSLVFFCTYKLHTEPQFVSVLYVVNNVASFLLIMFVSKAALKIGKQRYMVKALTLTAALAVGLFVVGITNKLMIVGYLMLFAFGQSSFWQLCNTNLYDITDLDEYRSGQRREGNIMALQSLICTAGTSVTLKILTSLLEASGFDATLATQTPSALSMLSIVFILLPGIGYGLSAYFMSRYRVNKEGFTLLKEFVYRREQGLQQLDDDSVEQIEAMFK